MFTQRIVTLCLVAIMSLSVCNTLSAQRRARPGSMKHTEADVRNAQKTTQLKGLYIRDNSTFGGDVYMIGDAGSIKIGTAEIRFTGGHYRLIFDSGEFSMRTSLSKKERIEKGITEYEYDHSWKNEKLGEDFEYSGKYNIQEQYGKISLILYNGDTDKEYARIALTSANDKEFEFSDDDLLMTMKLIK